jgi:hypothetical protein
MNGAHHLFCTEKKTFKAFDWSASSRSHMELNGIVLHVQQLLPVSVVESTYSSIRDMINLTYICKEWRRHFVDIVERKKIKMLARKLPFIDPSSRRCKFSSTYTVPLENIHLNVGYIINFIDALEELIEHGTVHPVLVFGSIFQIPVVRNIDPSADEFDVTCTFNFILLMMETFVKRYQSRQEIDPIFFDTVYAAFFNLFLRYVIRSHHLWPEMPTRLCFGKLILWRVKDCRELLLTTSLQPVNDHLAVTLDEVETLMIGLGVEAFEAVA